MSTREYSRDSLKVIVAQLCQTIGWHSIHNTALEVLTDVLENYCLEMGTDAHEYAELSGRTEANMDDFAKVCRNWCIFFDDMDEYVDCFESMGCRNTPRYPVERENHLNLLKPGSREVVTRPVHIHEHLPAMHPELEEEDYGAKNATLTVDTAGGTESSSPPLSSPKGANLFKRPGDPITPDNSAKRARLVIEEEGRPLREISSVMMTTSGFLSPAREGKLPEARTPASATDSNSRSNSPQPSPSSYPTVPPEVKGEKKVKKTPTVKMGLENTAKKLDSESKIKGLSQEISPLDDDDAKVKKLVAMKEYSKLKPFKSGALKMLSQNNVNSAGHMNKGNQKNVKNKISPVSTEISGLNVLIPKISKLPAAKSPKVDLLANTSSGSNVHKTSPPEKVKVSSNIEGKLPSEPDKQKLNIFKKISKVKEEKFDHTDGGSKNESNNGSGLAREAARLAQINETIESVIQRSRDEIKETVLTSTSFTSHAVSQGHVSDNDSFQFDTPPGTPRTPELPTIKSKSESKKKRKMKERKEGRDRFLSSPKHIKSEPLEPEFMEKPKTPEVEMSHDDSGGPPPVIPTPSPVFPFFPNFSSTPGLIPPPIGHPGLFPRFPLGKHGSLIPPLPSHPGIPNLPMRAFILQPPRPVSVDDMLMQRMRHVPVPTSTTPVTSPSSTITQHSSPSSNLCVTKGEPIEKLSPVSSAAVTAYIKEKSKDERKKEHKKEKKDKIKKKKDKKDKMKNKEKSEKKKEKAEKKEKDKEKLKEKKEKKEKKREKERELAMSSAPSEKSEEKMASSNGHSASVPKITFRLGPGSPQPLIQSPPSVPETTHRKIVIKPVKKPEECTEERARQTEEANNEGSVTGRDQSPELARICALVTRPPKQKSISKTQFPVEPGTASSPGPSKPKKPSINLLSPKVKSKEIKKPVKETEQAKEPAPFYYDVEGNQVWICPGCGGQDDGSPMIGCDGCDAWYHWVCVGIQVPPDSNDWFCRVCIGKKDEIVGEKKKKIRKKKNSS